MTFRVFLLSSLFLITSLTGCVGQFTTENIEARYRQCLSTTDIERQTLEQICADDRAYDYDYRVSLRRMFSGAPGGIMLMRSQLRME